jgi:hypothetical protein
VLPAAVRLDFAGELLSAVHCDSGNHRQALLIIVRAVVAVAVEVDAISSELTPRLRYAVISV